LTPSGGHLPALDPQKTSEFSNLLSRTTSTRASKEATKVFDTFEASFEARLEVVRDATVEGV